MQKLIKVLTEIAHHLENISFANIKTRDELIAITKELQVTNFILDKNKKFYDD